MLRLNEMGQVSELLATALAHHQADRLQQAEQLYRQVLARDPKHAVAWHLVGVVALQLGRHQMAAECIGRAIGFKPNVAIFHSNLGVALRALGNPGEAAACWRRAIELQPDYAEAHNNLGVILKEQGKLDAAIACWRRALELKPDYVEAHNNLGVALTERGKLHEAAACCRRSLELNPNYAEAHNNLGNVYTEQGKLEEAAACYRSAVRLKPGYAEAYNNFGSVLRKQGKLPEAVVQWRRAVDLNPQYAEAHNNLGVALKEQGKPDEAAACWRRAIVLKPDYVEPYNNLGNVLADQEKLDEAAACYQRALELKPSFAEAHVGLGSLRHEQGLYEQALTHYRRALDLNADLAEAHCNLGVVFKELNDLEAAERSLREAVRCDPRQCSAQAELATLLRGKLPEADLAAQLHLLSERGLLDDQRAALSFGLAHVFDGRGEYVLSAEHLRQANALRLAEWRRRGFDPAAHTRLTARIEANCTADFFQRVRGFGSDSQRPVFIVGLARSGTTLIEQILASHSQVFGAGELYLAKEGFQSLGRDEEDSADGLGRLDRQTAHTLAARHLQRLQALHGTAARVTDKMPDNCLYLGLLATLFPQARFIHCRRDVRDVAVSCWMTDFRMLPWANDPQHIVSRIREYQHLMEHWRKVLPVHLLEVSYEETVADLEAVARRLVAWCGLQWEPACLEFYRGNRPIRTASVTQVRQPIYATSLGRWKRYEFALGPMLEQLSEPEPS
ncbi:MAG: tetratricopeptide repeat protein [Thermoguttaceae bacterium]|jgi:tetratricopeptide (TPR) repeat protein